jgi:hypothetical protein
MNLSKIKAFRSSAGITLFMVGVVIVRRAAKYDVEILLVLSIPASSADGTTPWK